MKKIISLMLAVITVLSLASCQLSQIVPPAVTTEGQTQNSTTAPESTTGAEEEEELPSYDYMANDLTQFVTLCDYKGIKITDKRIEVTDAMVDRYIGEQLIMKNEYTKRKTGVVNEYDALNMDFVGKYKDTGVAFAGGSAMNVNFFVTMDQDTVYGIDMQSFTPGYNYIEGFATEMIGKDISAPFDINVKFPDNYDSKDLAGKEAIFTITVNYVCTPNELSASNLSLLTDKNVINDYKAEVKSNLKAQYDETARSLMDVAVWDYLVENCEFKALPDEYVNEFYESELSYLKYVASMYGYELDAFLPLVGYSSLEDFKEKYVIYSVKQNIIIHQILKDEKLDFTDETYKTRLEKFAEELGMEVEEVEQKYSKDELLTSFRYEVINEFIFSSCELVKEQ